MPSGSQLLTLERMLFAADMPVAGASELVTIAGARGAALRRGA